MKLPKYINTTYTLPRGGYNLYVCNLYRVEGRGPLGAWSSRKNRKNKEEEKRKRRKKGEKGEKRRKKRREREKRKKNRKNQDPCYEKLGQPDLKMNEGS